MPESSRRQPDDTARPDDGSLGLRDLSPAQWRTGLAAWLGWLFDGLDMHLYTLVALPFVAELLGASQTDPRTGQASAWIQASFLVGWAAGGGFFGRIGDRLGRTRTLMLTILTYAAFTGLSFFAGRWWHLLVFRFLAALGIGGEWAVGASLLAETWPRRLRPWVAAVLQTSGNGGVLLAGLAYYCLVLAGLPNRGVFLVGILPALLVLWVRRAVPESARWQQARSRRGSPRAGLADLFRAPLRRTTLLTMAVCAASLTAHWAFMFWCSQHLRGLGMARGWPEPQVSRLVSQAMMLVMVCSITGNFVAAALARRIGYRLAIALLLAAYFTAMTACHVVPRELEALWGFLAAIGLCQGVFALFTMYLPPLFPTLLRTTGAGLCYNLGRVVAAGGTVFFGFFSQVGDYRLALLASGFLFIPAAAVTCLLPEGAREPRIRPSQSDRPHNEAG